MIKYYTPLLIIFISIFSGNIYPQLSLSTKIDNYYDDNIYNNSYKMSDYINSFSLSTSYDFESEINNLQLYYINNLSYFQKNIFKSSNSHKFGIVNTLFISDAENPLNIGVNYSFRKNRDDYKLFDFNQLSGYANYRHFFNDRDFLLFGYLFNKNTYTNLSMFSFYENKGFIKYSSTFDTKTTLMIGTEAYFKNYVEKINELDNANNSSQISAYLNLAQSLSDNTGIAGYIFYRNNMENGTRYLYSDSLIYYEEEIFNDIYSHEGYEAGISLTQIVVPSILARLEISYDEKNFSNLPAATIDGYELSVNRKDNQFSFGFELQFNLHNLINGLTLTGTYNYISNNSNDEFYHYDNQIFMVTFGWGL